MDKLTDQLFALVGIDRMPRFLRYIVIFALIGAAFYVAEHLWERTVKHLD